MKGHHDDTFGARYKAYHAELAKAAEAKAKPKRAPKPAPATVEVAADDGGEDLSGLKVSELRKLASAAGVEGYRSMSKSQLLAALS